MQHVAVWFSESIRTGSALQACLESNTMVLSNIVVFSQKSDCTSLKTTVFKTAVYPKPQYFWSIRYSGMDQSFLWTLV